MNNSNKTDNDLLGPGTDLMISLLGVLLMSIAINAKIHENEQEYLTKIKDHQKVIVEKIKKEFPNCTERKDSVNHFLYIDQDTFHDIHIFNDVTLQKISFGDKILFDKSETTLKDTGIIVLQGFKKAIETNLDYLEEINIQGHADTTGNEKRNFFLGYERALTVYETMQISPISHLISITSFGHFKPEERDEYDLNFNRKKLNSMNRTSILREKNRRIDIVLHYRENLNTLGSRNN